MSIPAQSCQYISRSSDFASPLTRLPLAPVALSMMAIWLSCTLLLDPTRCPSVIVVLARVLPIRMPAHSRSTALFGWSCSNHRWCGSLYPQIKPCFSSRTNLFFSMLYYPEFLTPHLDLLHQSTKIIQLSLFEKSNNFKFN